MRAAGAGRDRLSVWYHGEIRPTPAQLGVHLICGREFPRNRGTTLEERIEAGRELLAKVARKDFGYDLPAWHAHLKETRQGGYTWGRNIDLPRVMKEEMASAAWRAAVAKLEAEGATR